MDVRSVDVVLPNYNKVEYIAECLDSLQAQTYPHWRCIVIDGYSDDGSWEILTERAQNDDRFELHQLGRIGLYKSWNKGLSKVQNPYFAILTSDDIWEPNWLSRAVQSMKTHDAVAVASRTRSIDSSSNPGEVTKLNRFGEHLLATSTEPVEKWPGVACSVATMFVGSIFTSIHSLVMSTELLETMRFAPAHGSAADWAWAVEIGLYGPIVYHKDVSAYWRCYDGQASGVDFEVREENGQHVIDLFEALRPRIAARLPNAAQDTFFCESNRLLQIDLPYFFARPSLSAVFEDPRRGTSKLLQLLLKYPNIVFREGLSLLLGKERYINTRRLNAAKRVLEPLFETVQSA